ncbi:MAG: hypothetical protein IPP74_13560 [Alphaproteobacteria bacterium]|nr:hypothetical protein [Alphaproteobacteria bacterium]
MSNDIDIFMHTVHQYGLPFPEREYKFHPTRKWRFDYAYPQYKIAIEKEGGTWAYGRHNRPQGFKNDCEKYSHAAILGWKIIRGTTEQFDDGLVASWVIEAISREINNE